MKLADYLKQEIQLSDDTIQAFDRLWDSQHFLKGHQLVGAGSHSKKVFYIEKGLARIYYLNDGKDITQFFFDETSIYTPIENVFLNEYHPYYLELLEDSTVRTVDFSRIEELLDTNVKFQRFVRYIMTGTIKKLADRLRSVQLQTAQDRYRILLETYPDILLRAPLGHIASYLGITQQTLSVIRAKKSK